MQGAPAVGKYVVDVPSIERLALPALLQPAGSHVALIVLDEVSKRQLCSGQC